MGRSIGRRGVAVVAGAVTLAAMLVAPVAAQAAPGSAAGANAKANPFGIQVVRFAPGTSPDVMRQAVANAGGEVLTDLTALNALAVVPKNASSFGASIKGQRGVQAAWVDHVNQGQRSGP